MRRLTLVASALAAVAISTPAHAQTDPFDNVVEIDDTPKDYHSPQHWALEFKGGAYSPQIDSTAGLHGTPFADLFNNQYDPNQRGKRPGDKPVFILELDWQFWHPFGSFGLAGSVGYYGRTTHSFEYNMVDGMPVSCTVNQPAITDSKGNVTTPGVVGNCVRSSDTSAFSIFPITLELVYRFDVLALRYNVPLVPYVKAGLAYYFWFMQDGAGNLARALPSQGSGQAIGGVPGFVAHPGLALMLDMFDRSAAATLDSELGINHTYIFAELNYANVSGLGIFKNKIDLSDLTWNAGLAFEF